jgi:hypothetical protein
MEEKMHFTGIRLHFSPGTYIHLAVVIRRKERQYLVNDVDEGSGPG